MKCLVLAAGEGVRLRPLTANTPKSLLTVAGKPFLEHLLHSLRTTGIRDVTLLVGWREERVREYFSDGKKFGVRLDYLEQEERLGTAHTIGMACGIFDSDFLCLNSDIVLSPKDLRQLLLFQKKNRCTTMSLANVSPDDVGRYGVVETEGNKVKSIAEKPKKSQSILVNAGAYVLKPEIFEAIERTEKSPRGEYEITSSLQMLADRGNVRAYLLKEQWIDISYPWDLLAANEVLLKDLRKEVRGNVDRYATIVGQVKVGKGTKIRNGSYIQGPVFIGEDCEIGPNCYIRPSTHIGDNCKIGNAVEVKNSIIMSRTHIPHLNYIGDSVIGEDCNFGAGTKIANLRLDETGITVTTLKGERHSTGRRKFGAIIGDSVKTGINCSIDVGSIIGEESFIGPGAVVQGTVAPRSRIH